MATIGSEGFTKEADSSLVYIAGPRYNYYRRIPVSISWSGFLFFSMTIRLPTGLFG